ncbi:hypothetical protein N656DRAFT_829569 [Canariomyces notabilis]|uniref:Zn(2)-C6 fungal-type domain-containing protein n=1 Tax=Canariomyces notabilis TaxID=2074819 RepID=A0AAN6YRX7_9PEZI|nr:hypothetical protein N656DRAFT_829569 [Canariomyces arenarius]
MPGLGADSEQQLRHACDRCHSQKLRCPRSVDPEKNNPDEPCSRCRKAGLPWEQHEGVDAVEDHLITAVLDLAPRQTVATPPPTISDEVGMEHPPSPPPTHASDRLVTSETSYDFFLTDFDTSLDLPTFCIPNDLTNGLEPAAKMPSPIGQTGGTPVDPSLMKEMMSGAFDSNHIPPARPPLHPFSSNDCYMKLSDLNARILASYTETTSSASTYSTQNLKVAVGFCGELIDVARRSFTHFVGFSPPSSSRSSVSRSTLSGTEHPTASRPREASINSGLSVDDMEWTGPESLTNNPSIIVPDSAVIFLLLGCYTQILRLFEVTTNHLWAWYGDDEMPATSSNQHSSGIVSSPLLEAALAVHTVGYLLGRLNKAFTIDEPGCHPGAGDGASNVQRWKRSFLGGKELDDGLLARAFDEITGREQRLMRRTQDLQQRIN